MKKHTTTMTKMLDRILNAVGPGLPRKKRRRKKIYPPFFLTRAALRASRVKRYPIEFLTRAALRASRVTRCLYLGITRDTGYVTLDHTGNCDLIMSSMMTLALRPYLQHFRAIDILSSRQNTICQ